MDQNDKVKQIYWNKRSQNICISCGKPLDRDGAYCADCLVKERKYIQKLNISLERHGLCLTCRKRKTTDGYLNCPVCRAKARKRASAYYKRKLEEKAGDADG